jgi:hypothetical protein
MKKHQYTFMLMLFTFMISSLNLKILPSISKSDVLMANEVNDDISVKDASSSTIHLIHSIDFYRFLSNDVVYYVGNQFIVDDTLMLIRTMDDFNLYPYECTDVLDREKKIIEIQRYNQNTFYIIQIQHKNLTYDQIHLNLRIMEAS